MRRLLKIASAAALVVVGLASSLQAQTALHDPNLPTVKPDALQQLSDDRIQQQILLHSQARYAGRCVCPYMTRDSHGRSCKARHEVIKSNPVPMCYPRQVTPEMISAWRRQHP